MTMLPLDHGRVGRAVQGQVSMARKRAKHGFIAVVRKYGHQILIFHQEGFGRSSEAKRNFWSFTDPEAVPE
ncbi:hypothetical protein DPMN_112484 [Dreissena polymorpha]|uniref:Uncharacterized protein n=1 Tax=Dreissena polymorpha TaxID=45954 RepID=A0A9D4KFR3_DREPO|nr:hypothetical protein DPMN_112484 [Dreissena polymorpha]